MGPFVSCIYLTYGMEYVWKSSLWIGRVYFKKLLNEQEYYWPTINRAGAAVVSTITSSHYIGSFSWRLACVASVSVWFGSKERPGGTGFSVLAAREMKHEPKNESGGRKRGRGRGRGRRRFPSFLPHPLPALLLTPFFAQSLTIVPRSLLLNRTETPATQATWRHEKLSA